MSSQYFLIPWWSHNLETDRGSFSQLGFFYSWDFLHLSQRSQIGGVFSQLGIFTVGISSTHLCSRLSPPLISASQIGGVFSQLGFPPVILVLSEWGISGSGFPDSAPLTTPLGFMNNLSLSSGCTCASQCQDHLVFLPLLNFRFHVFCTDGTSSPDLKALGSGECFHSWDFSQTELPPPISALSDRGSVSVRRGDFPPLLPALSDRGMWMWMWMSMSGLVPFCCAPFYKGPV